MLIEEVSISERLEEIREVRFTVFVEEQKVPEELEMDEWDDCSRHVLASIEDKPVGTGRLLPDGHIGRVAVLREFRGHGIGLAIMKQLMRIGLESDITVLELSAQVQAIGFYEKLGFEKRGPIYLEAGIDHIQMRFSPNEVS